MTEQEARLTKNHKHKIVLHSFICVGIGLIGGLGWVMVLAGSLELWPIPPIDLSLPMTKELWRNAHIGPIMNGIFTMAIVSVSSYLLMRMKFETIFYRCILTMLYGNLIGYKTAPFISNRGLAPHDGFMNVLCYFSFYTAALAAILLVGMAICAAKKSLKS